MSTKTEHLGLHQWEPEDSFLRTDFNEDFAKIDAAVGRTEQTVLLREMVTTDASQQVDVDLTGIDWAKYRRVELFIRGGGGSHHMGSMAVNGITDIKSYSNFAFGSSTWNGYNYLGIFSAGTGATRLIIHGQVEGVSVLFLRMGAMSTIGTGFMTEESGVKLADVHTLNLINNNTYGALEPGMKISIFGVLA